jgi:hypothetical protein
VSNTAHSGACSFCGTHVHAGFNTCPSCGANYRRLMTGAQAVILMSFVTLFGLPAAVFLAMPITGGVGVLGSLFGFRLDASAPGTGDVLYLTICIIVYAAIWIFTLRYCLRGTKRSMWFRAQS